MARGDATASSDIDLAVLFEQPTADTLRGPLAGLRLDLEDALGRPVDLVAIENAPPDLIHRVLRDGILLVDRNPNRRIAFEVRARNDYFDLLPYLHEYRRAGFA
ncbi:DNA polymerase, beta domain protein region [Thioalkalivibrio nitratireducens DSM 14787]|uniref:DNA polymerase, beta domain protein region n=2 Tax=Thioalkalivibrio nitratireducens TaxID=186931 RepID=L0DRY7_THIND|nr:DNA polymerase, beta domain protein region [Thioalkalivibrio nitratireducens DSM 14787]